MIPALDKYTLYKTKYDDLLNMYNNIISKGHEIIHPTVEQNISARIMSQMNNVSDIINLVLTDNTIGVSDDIKSFEFNFDRKFFDKKGDFKNILTDFVTNEFFYGDEYFYKFIHDFYSLSKSCIDAYIAINKFSDKGVYLNDKIIFILKGGCILKSVFEKYLYSQFEDVKEIIFEHFKDYFKRSDLDFQIIINTKLSDNVDLNKDIYTEIVDDIRCIMLYTLNRFRNKYITNIINTFNFYQLNNETKQAKLSKIISKLNDVLIDPNYQTQIKAEHKDFAFILNYRFNNIYFNGVYDKQKHSEFITKKNQNKLVSYEEMDHALKAFPNNYKNDIYVENVEVGEERIMNVKKLSYSDNIIDTRIENQLYKNMDKVSEHYITIINKIKYLTASDTRSFTLLRMKVNFLLTLKEQNDTVTDPSDSNTKVGVISIPGELIDIAINNFEDSRNGHITDNFTDYFADYKFTNINSKYTNPFTFKSYSLDGLINDLFEMIYIDNILPWDAKKYNKRVKRVLFFSMIKILSSSTNYALLTDIQSIFTTVNTEADINNIIINGDYFIALLAQLNAGANPACNDIVFCKILTRHKEMFNYIHAPERAAKLVANNLEFLEYYKAIKEFCGLMIRIQEVIRTVCDNNIIGKIDVNIPKFNNIHQIGGIYDKYIKYKTKYYKTKYQSNI